MDTETIEVFQNSQLGCTDEKFFSFLQAEALVKN